MLGWLVLLPAASLSFAANRAAPKLVPLVPPAIVAPAAAGLVASPRVLDLALSASDQSPRGLAQLIRRSRLEAPERAAIAQLAARSWAQLGVPDDAGLWRSPRGSAPALEQLRSALAEWDKNPEAVDAAAAAWALSVPAPARARPLARGKLPRVVAHLFDIDDNLFLGLGTRIILFRKGGEEELALSTKEYAAVRASIGAPEVVELAGRRIDLSEWEKRHESFREFRDPPNGNNFIKAVREMLDTRPESEWQGPQWKAFARALADPDTARHVGILTARNHRARSFLEAFELLRERGYIKHAPDLALMHAVGDSADNAAAKAEVMKLFLDRVQATPVGRKARPVLEPDGRKRRRLHTAEFSDDDRGNFEKMAQELSAELRRDPARWSKVKIVLHYTGTGRRFSLVLTSRGGRRVTRATERAERP